MQSSLLRLAVALLTFGLGVSATMFWIAYRTPHAEKHKAAGCSMRPLLPLPPAPGVEELPPAPPAPPAPPRFARAPIASGLLNHKALSKPAPVYPRAAVASGAAGMVNVQLLVDESGKVISAEAVSGHPLLREAATAAAYQARFSPTLFEGLPVKISGVVSYYFVLP
jgi:TonB family protein